MVGPPVPNEAEGLRVVFFGTPQFAVPTLEALLASRHRVVGVITQPDRPRGRGQRVTDAPVKAAAVAHALPIVQPATLRGDDAAAALAAWAPDLGVVAAYGQLIPKALLELPRFGMINVHASLLPKYRGAAPVHRAIIAGDTETGVTIMRVAPRLDAGAMFAKVIVPIGPDQTSDELERELAVAGARLLVQVTDAIAGGTAREEAQDDSQVTYAARLTKEEGLIDWSQPAQRIHDRVRGLFPWPHAYSYVNGRRVIVWRTSTSTDTGDTPRELAPGTPAPPGSIVRADAHGLHAAAGDGRLLALLELQSEGGRPLRAQDFLRGQALQPGMRFTGP
jgi:methionyl-tRNA formyltransferase